MRRMFKEGTVGIGLAMFAMFFGAGNVVFPLALGQYAGAQTGWAMLGMFTTAIIVPFLGLISIVLFDSDHRAFFGRMGKLLGFLVGALILLMIGPFGGIPRTITLSYSTLSYAIPGIPLWIFSLGACIVIFAGAWQRSRVVDLVGYLLTPLLLFSLVVIILAGVLHHPQPAETHHSHWTIFLEGLLQGYNTLDLLAACFFSSVVLAALIRHHHVRRGETALFTHRMHLRTLLKSSLLGACLLGIIYTGLSFVASFHHQAMEGVDSDQLLSALSLHLMGPYAGIVSNVAVMLACLTTAITLAAVFSDTLSREVFKEKVSYPTLLLITVSIAYFVSYLRFTGIVQAVYPILILFYPSLIVLALSNLAYKIWGFKPVKVPVYSVFFLTAIVWIALNWGGH
ncbi:MAG: branched-chain amino acid transport system II carrier protein [Verrucomicrobia bacterium]|nr:branched-chain amino acid transport system II carrier protein [Verrucomicrobiota bacterium]